jgi:hypothetical protein
VGSFLSQVGLVPSESSQYLGAEAIGIPLVQYLREQSTDFYYVGKAPLSPINPRLATGIASLHPAAAANRHVWCIQVLLLVMALALWACIRQFGLLGAVVAVEKGCLIKTRLGQ